MAIPGGDPTCSLPLVEHKEPAELLEPTEGARRKRSMPLSDCSQEQLSGAAHLRWCEAGCRGDCRWEGCCCWAVTPQ